MGGVSRPTIYRWIEDGLDLGDEYEPLYLTAVRLAGVYYIDPDDLTDFLDMRDGALAADIDDDDGEYEDQEEDE